MQRDVEVVINIYCLGKCPGTCRENSVSWVTKASNC